MTPRRKHFQTGTFHARRLGAAFDPDKVCEYTGLPLNMFPLEVGDNDPGFMGFWRTDGELCGAYPLTPEEKAWIQGNPLQYQEKLTAFERWLSNVRIQQRKNR